MAQVRKQHFLAFCRQIVPIIAIACLLLWLAMPQHIDPIVDWLDARLN